MVVKRRISPLPLPSVAEMANWLDRNNLPYSLGGIFSGDTNKPLGDTENQVAALLWSKRDLLIRPLQEVSELIQSEDHWYSFAYELSWSGMKWSEQALSLKRDKAEKATKIKKKIAKKADEIVGLALELEEIGEYWRTRLRSSDFYDYLLSKAADLQNSAYFSESEDFPGLYSGYSGIPGVFDTGKYCTYKEGLDAEFRYLWHEKEKDLSIETMPIIECLIVAYARSFEEKRLSLAQLNDPQEFSQNSVSPALFVRGFTSQLSNYVNGGHLPKSIKRLSFPSIEAFATVLFPNREKSIEASKYIDKDWNPTYPGIEKKSINKL